MKRVACIVIAAGLASVSGAVLSQEEQIYRATPKRLSSAELKKMAPKGKGNSYVFNTMQITTDKEPRGCRIDDWPCRERLCVRDLEDEGGKPWLVDGICLRLSGDRWTCLAECAQVRRTN